MFGVRTHATLPRHEGPAMLEAGRFFVYSFHLRRSFNRPLLLFPGKSWSMVSQDSRRKYHVRKHASRCQLMGFWSQGEPTNGIQSVTTATKRTVRSDFVHVSHVVLKALKEGDIRFKWPDKRWWAWKLQVLVDKAFGTAMIAECRRRLQACLHFPRLQHDDKQQQFSLGHHHHHHHHHHHPHHHPHPHPHPHHFHSVFHSFL